MLILEHTVLPDAANWAPPNVWSIDVVATVRGGVWVLRRTPHVWASARVRRRQTDDQSAVDR